LNTALTHLSDLTPFPARIGNENPADGWTGNARAVIVANANYPWCPGRSGVCIAAAEDDWVISYSITASARQPQA
jgi:hypothetical protein